MAKFASNCKISGPAAVAATPHVDFNGLQWSYTIGLMFPAAAAAATVPQNQPDITSIYQAGA